MLYIIGVMRKETNIKREGEAMKDSMNPNFIFQTIDTSLLYKIIRGNLDPVKSAKEELASRGLGLNCEWVGFNNAKKVHGLI